VPDANEVADVCDRISLQHDEVRVCTNRNPPGLVDGSKSSSGGARQRPQDLVSAHARQLHRHILFGRIVVGNEADVGSKQDLATCLAELANLPQEVLPADSIVSSA
jgi:hypothetical protein